MKKCLAIDIGGSKVLVGGARQKHRVRSLRKLRLFLT